MVSWRNSIYKGGGSVSAAPPPFQGHSERLRLRQRDTLRPDAELGGLSRRGPFSFKMQWEAKSDKSGDGTRKLGR